jgi:hypothetical protein
MIKTTELHLSNKGPIPAADVQLLYLFITVLILPIYFCTLPARIRLSKTRWRVDHEFYRLCLFQTDVTLSDLAYVCKHTDTLICLCDSASSAIVVRDFFPFRVKRIHHNGFPRDVRH